MSELPRGKVPVEPIEVVKTITRDAARVYMTALGFKLADVTRELPDAPAGTLEVTKRGLLSLHGVTEFEYKRAGGQL